MTNDAAGALPIMPAALSRRFQGKGMTKGKGRS
jgi:hypothetical protein